jgi:hypothetical protein
MIMFFAVMFFIVIIVSILWTHGIDTNDIDKKSRDDIEFP